MTHDKGSRCPECLWALYDGRYCQNKDCRRFGKRVKSPIYLTNEEAIKMINENTEHATSTIVLRVTPSHKAAYVRAARPGTLSAFMLGAADEKAANAKPGPPVKVEIGIGNSCGDMFAIRDAAGKCFLVIEDDDLRDGSTFPNIEIPAAVFNALVRHIEESQSREVEWQCTACGQVVTRIRLEFQSVADAKIGAMKSHRWECIANLR